jgi:hypothetical protein
VHFSCGECKKRNDKWRSSDLAFGLRWFDITIGVISPIVHYTRMVQVITFLTADIKKFQITINIFRRISLIPYKMASNYHFSSSEPAIGISWLDFIYMFWWTLSLRTGHLIVAHSCKMLQLITFVSIHANNILLTYKTSLYATKCGVLIECELPPFRCNQTEKITRQ